VSFEAEVLARQLGQLGKDLDTGTALLGSLEQLCTEAEGNYRIMVNEHQKALDRAYLVATGTVDDRKAQARLRAEPQQDTLEETWRHWQGARNAVHLQEKSLSALARRIDIGRSLLSREKALMSIAGVNQT
jgi:hypothetical protein